MELSNLAVTVIATIMLLVGLVMLLFPAAIHSIESFLNRSWGEKELFALRLGTRRERMMEPRLNRSVLAHSIHWDGWLRNRPRLSGMVICAIALLLVWY